MLPDWTAETVVCIASGPSLTDEDCEAVRASGHPVVVTNTTFRRCAWAQALFGFDRDWWRRYIEEVRSVFAGRLFSKSPQVSRLGVEYLGRQFRCFGNSGADAISMAIDAGASKVVALGYDCQMSNGQSHHHGDHPAGIRNCDTMSRWPGQFAGLAKHARSNDVMVLNASRATALECFPRMTLEACL